MDHKNFRITILLLTAMLSLLLADPSLHAAATGGPGPQHHPEKKQEFYNIRIYQLSSKLQEARVDSFLRQAFLPALHRLGIARIGVFKPVANDTAAIRRIYVLIPFHSLDQYGGLETALGKDAQYQAEGNSYLNAIYSDPPYLRIESLLLQAFPGMPEMKAPATLKASPSERIYELRSYEGPTEQLFANKVRMFNEGGEIELFQRLGFNAVFYATVLSGGHMPNLMYMTTFDSIDSRNQHWKAFGEDPFWKKLSAAPEFQHNVSHIDDVFLHPADYSDL